MVKFKKKIDKYFFFLLQSTVSIAQLKQAYCWFPQGALNWNNLKQII